MFISFEGADGAGKTTQAALLVSRLAAAGHRALAVREPGGTPAGEALRQVLKAASGLSPLAELLMFEAARVELVEKVVRPALSGGAVVVADRFSDSSIAYQGYGRGLTIHEVERLNHLATSGLKPDVTVLLDIPAELAVARTSGRDRGSTRTGFETEAIEFHRRVIEGYRALALKEPGRWEVIDGSAGESTVAEAVWRKIAGRLRTNPKPLH
jgi:dTMP kinase